jgi:hypothetical protein
VKELIGFAVGAATGAAAAILATAPEGRAYIEKVRRDAEPELAKAAEELEPIARNVVRAAKLALDDLGVATDGLRAWIAEAAAEVAPADGPTTAPEDAPAALLEAGDGATGMTDAADDDVPGAAPVALSGDASLQPE